jgi:hypothetical protein
MPLVGTMWMKNLARSKLERSTPLDAVAAGTVRLRPTPGWSRLTKMRPSVSETRLAQTNQKNALRPTRPIAPPPPIWAMPTTSVETTSGAMIILIKWRNIWVGMSRP